MLLNTCPLNGSGFTRFCYWRARVRTNHVSFGRSQLTNQHAVHLVSGTQTFSQRAITVSVVGQVGGYFHKIKTFFSQPSQPLQVQGVVLDMVGKIWNSESRTWGPPMKKWAFLADLLICAPDSGGLEIGKKAAVFPFQIFFKLANYTKKFWGLPFVFPEEKWEGQFFPILLISS